ncbi:hypothetical protein GCM10023341_21460 [Ornithinimicrobium tianjinense]
MQPAQVPGEPTSASGAAGTRAQVTRHQQHHQSGADHGEAQTDPAVVAAVLVLTALVVDRLLQCVYGVPVGGRAVHLGGGSDVVHRQDAQGEEHDEEESRQRGDAERVRHT